MSSDSPPPDGDTAKPAKPEPQPMDRNLGAWLAGAGPSDLRECSDTERRKVCAIGYTVLVPTIFAFIAASYAVSTLTDNPAVIYLIAVAWAAIILLVDRAIITSYSPFMKKGSKAAVVSLRMAVAVLMGLTVSHPLTLLLFKDTITNQIEAQRANDVDQLAKVYAARKAEIEGRKAMAIAERDKLDKALKETFENNFIKPAEKPTVAIDIGLTAQERLDLDKRIEESTKALKADLTKLETATAELEARKAELQTEINDWQKQFEDELNGKRSGRPGKGPRSDSILQDQLAPRRTDMTRMTTELAGMNVRREELAKTITAAADAIRKEVERSAVERAARAEEDAKRLADLQRQDEEKRLADYQKAREALREQINVSIKVVEEDRNRASEELTALGREESKAMEALSTAPREDLLAQTLALHHLFKDPEAGGTFALMAYLVLAGLFLAVDTMPILVKFTSKKGEFDVRREQALIEVDEGILKNIPSSARQIKPNELDALHEKVVTHYRNELDRQLAKPAQTQPGAASNGSTPDGSGPVS
ncbi:MAG: DUF4407 domain-containing protein [Verrucomicrobia bacterium]|nr:DUF4407 domain-containing protein [Verrucomicrobiota bacterium]